MKRQRGRGRRSGGGNNNNPNKHFESNGPDVKIRGSAQQILEKYQQYARDAQSSGDRVNAENYLQHAEHYYRVLAAMTPAEKPQRDARDSDNNEDDDEDSPDGDSDASASNSQSEGGQKRDGSREQNRDQSRARDRDRDRNRDRNRDRRDNAERKADDTAPAEQAATQMPEIEAIVADAFIPSVEEGPAVSVVMAAETAEKPKRRRAYKKREEEPETGIDGDDGADGDDGIMKTLSRGRKPSQTADATGAADAD